MAKVSDEELAEIQGLHKAFADLATHIGELTIQKKLLTNELDNADHAVTQFQETQKALLEKLQTKYGVGTVDMSTGEFNSTGS
jgi:chromosome segregation ATPase